MSSQDLARIAILGLFLTHLFKGNGPNLLPQFRERQRLSRWRHARR